MSRTSFAQTFLRKLGTTFMEDLTRWRMLLAGDRLRSSGDPIAAIAYSVGHASESAFGADFPQDLGVYAKGA